MSPILQRLITIVAGVVGAWLATHVPGIQEQHATEIAAALLAFAVGYATRHPADSKEIPSAAIIQYEQLRKLGIDPSPRPKADGEGGRR